VISRGILPGGWQKPIPAWRPPPPSTILGRMARALVLVALALSLLPACEPRGASSDAGSAPIASSTTGTRAPESALPMTGQLVVRPVSAGFGGVGPYIPPPQPDLFVVLFVEVEAAAPRTGVEVTSIELLDADGKVIARAKPPFELRRDTVSDPAARKADYAEYGTVPFDGTIEPTRPLRLRVHAVLDARTEALPKPWPVRYRAALRAAGDSVTSIEGPLQGPWPTG